MFTTESIRLECDVFQQFKHLKRLVTGVKVRNRFELRPLRICFLRQCQAVCEALHIYSQGIWILVQWNMY